MRAECAGHSIPHYEAWTLFHRQWGNIPSWIVMIQPAIFRKITLEAGRTGKRLGRCVRNYDNGISGSEDG